MLVFTEEPRIRFYTRTRKFKNEVTNRRGKKGPSIFEPKKILHNKRPETDIEEPQKWACDNFETHDRDLRQKRNRLLLSSTFTYTPEYQEGRIFFTSYFVSSCNTLGIAFIIL